MAFTNGGQRTDALSSVLVRDVTARFGVELTVDAFATARNARYERYWTRGQDAMTVDWREDGCLWMTPPFSMMSEVAARMCNERPEAVVQDSTRMPQGEAMVSVKALHTDMTERPTLAE